MAYKSNGLQGAMNLTKSNRSSIPTMSAGFGPNGAPLARRVNYNKNVSQDEFTITHHDDKVEKPWGFPR